MIIMTIANNEDRNKAEQLYNRYRSTMLYIANGILHDNNLAEDAVSESFIKIIKNLDKINESDCYRTRAFLVIIVRNVSIDMLRNQKCDTTVPFDDYLDYEENGESVFEDIATKITLERVVSNIKKLKSNYTDILYLKAIYGYSTEKIAEILDITKENVLVRLNRARIALKEQLRKEDEFYE